MKKQLLAFLLLSSCTMHMSRPAHKIIVLVSPPRSLSTVFLRMMYARGDFTVMNEPFIATFVSHHILSYKPEWYIKPFTTYSSAFDAIYKNSEKHPVFTKGLACASYEAFTTDQRMITDDNVQFVFLLRNPHHTLISFYKKAPEIFLDNHKEIINYQAMHDLLMLIKKKGTTQPVLILAENLYLHPKKTINYLCQKLEIPFKPESLKWNKLTSSFTGRKEWHEPKPLESIHHWHADALESTHFHKPTQYKTDENGNPTFSEIANLEHRQICKKAYQEHLKYYQLIIKQFETF